MRFVFVIPVCLYRISQGCALVVLPMTRVRVHTDMQHNLHRHSTAVVAAVLLAKCWCLVSL